MFEIVKERDHFVILKDGIFWCSCDTYREAQEEIDIVQSAQTKRF